MTSGYTHRFIWCISQLLTLAVILFAGQYAVQGSASCLETTPAVHGLLLGARKLKELHQRPGSPASLIELEAHEKVKQGIQIRLDQCSYSGTILNSFIPCFQL